MSITPVVLNGMTQRTQDISNLKQQEDNRPVVQQHNLNVQQEKQTDKLTHQVRNPEEKENEGYRYDAKEKGNNQYEGNGKFKKKPKKEPEKESSKEGKVIFKGQSRSFDVKI